MYKYEIVARGLLGERLLAALPTLSAEAQRETALTGALADQAALYRVTQRSKRSDSS